MRSALVVFPDEWLVYSPTLLNLMAALIDRGWRVKVFAANNGRYPQIEIAGAEIIWVPVPKLFPIRLEKSFFYKLYKFLRILFSLSKIRGEKFRLIFGVDSIGFCAVRAVFPKAVYLSLELVQDIFGTLSKRIGIVTLLTQTEERRDYLVRDMPNVSTYYLQNAPVFDPNITVSARTGFKLIYFGNITVTNGVEYCIESLKCLDTRYTLTLKGLVYEPYRKILVEKYGELLIDNRLILDCEYIDQADVLKYLSTYDVGFCFYSDAIMATNDFNFVSCPSGKVFNYFAAGVPVIGINILGLKPVVEFNAGVLLDNKSPESIKEALEVINRNYVEYVQNCFNAARCFDFNSSVDIVLSELDFPVMSN